MRRSTGGPFSTGTDALERLSAVLAPACLLLAIALPAAVLWNWFAVGPSRLAAQAGIPLAAQFTWWQWLFGTALAVTPVGFMAAALLSARRCFSLFRRGSCLQREASQALRAFALWVLGGAIAGLVVPTVLVAVLTAAPDLRAIRWEIHLGSTPLLGLIFGGTLAALTCVLERAVAIAEEHAQIV